jgi:hypothetical protein
MSTPPLDKTFAGALRDLMTRMTLVERRMPKLGGGGGGGGTGLDAEAVRDLVGTLLVPGANVTITVDDAGNTITIASSGGLDAEAVRDLVGATLVAGTNITVTVDDAANTITVAGPSDTDLGMIPFPYNYPRGPWEDTTGWLLTQEPPADEPGAGTDPSTANGRGALGIGFVHADGESSVAIASGDGGFAQALGENSIAVGNNTEAWDEYTVVHGGYSRARGRGAATLGVFADAQGEGAVSLSYYSSAMAEETVGIGQYSRAWGPKSIAHGNFADARALRTQSIGADSDAMAPLSTVIGSVDTTEQEHAVVAGRNLEVSRSNHGDSEDYFSIWTDDYSTGLMLYSPSGDRWRVGVDDTGALVVVDSPWEVPYWPVVKTGGFWNAVTTNGDGAIVMAAGMNDFLLQRSTDFGATWASVTAAGSKQWRRLIMSADGVTIMAIGLTTGTPYVYTVHVSTNSGTSWTTRAVPITGISYPWDISGSADMSVVVATYGGLIWRSTNLGVSWTRLTPEVMPYGGESVVSVSADGDVVYVALFGGAFAVSTDRGVTYTLRTNIEEIGWPGYFQRVALGWHPLATNEDGSLVVAALDYGPIIYSEDYGVTWDEVPGSWSKQWNHLSLSDDGYSLVVGCERRFGLWYGDVNGIGYVNNTARSAWCTAVSRDHNHVYGAADSGGSSSSAKMLHFDATSF